MRKPYCVYTIWLSAEAIDLGRPYWILHPVSCYTPEAATTVSKCSWGWTQKASETCWVILQLLINILPSCITLVLYIYYWSSVVRLYVHITIVVRTYALYSWFRYFTLVVVKLGVCNGMMINLPSSKERRAWLVIISNQCPWHMQQYSVMINSVTE